MSANKETKREKIQINEYATAEYPGDLKEISTVSQGIAWQSTDFFHTACFKTMIPFMLLSLMSGLF